MAALEHLYEIRLPEDYRAFLRYAGDGGAGPGYGLSSFVQTMLPKDKSEMAPFPYETAQFLPPVLFEPEYEETEEDVPFPRMTGCLFLATHGCGDDNFLVVNGPSHGQVWASHDTFLPNVPLFAPLGCSFYNWYLRWVQ